ncbi:MAG: nitroreductase family protein [Pontiellaceae bacterium]|nr:nitroreductase family protein [Pontiellaceae bacterium]MBN2785555.1 nitroreductase family protein [Pontiellaceae bacterium]
MNFIELARSRCSIRKYKPEPVSEDLLTQVLLAGSLAPTAKNLQPFQFIVVRAPEQLDALAAAYPAPFLREAPVVIVICIDPGEAWVRQRHDDRNYCEVDAAIAVDHMALAATDLGLGTCWIAAFDPDMVAAAMQLPEGVEPLLLLPLGYPAEEGREKSRKSLEELVRYEHW